MKKLKVFRFQSPLKVSTYKFHQGIDFKQKNQKIFLKTGSFKTNALNSNFCSLSNETKIEFARHGLFELLTMHFFPNFS